MDVENVWALLEKVLSYDFTNFKKKKPFRVVYIAYLKWLSGIIAVIQSSFVRNYLLNILQNKKILGCYKSAAAVPE